MHVICQELFKAVEIDKNKIDKNLCSPLSLHYSGEFLGQTLSDTDYLDDLDYSFNIYQMGFVKCFFEGELLSLSHCS